MEYNFKTIKDKSSNLLLENIGSISGNKFSYKNFINEIKKSPILKTQFLVYTNIENKRFTDNESARMFLNENLKLFNSFTRKEIINENKKLVNKLFDTTYDEFQDNLFKLILESTKDNKINNIAEKVKIFSEITEIILLEPQIISEEIKSSNKIIDKKVIKRATEILNETYSFLNESERQILKSFIKNDNNLKETLFNNLISENLKLIKRKLFNQEELDDDIKNKLNLTEEKLKNTKYSNDIEIVEFSKLLELKENLR